MEELYPQIRAVHIGAVIASGALFALRGGALNLFAAAWPKGRPARILSWTIDSVLLAAALTLMTIVRQYPLLDAWLTVKVVLLLVYIGLGTQAFSLKRPRTARIGFWLAALAVFGFIVTVARAHHPLGAFAGLAG